jgi:hypothetical protein
VGSSYGSLLVLEGFPFDPLTAAGLGGRAADDHRMIKMMLDTDMSCAMPYPDCDGNTWALSSPPAGLDACHAISVCAVVVRRFSAPPILVEPGILFLEACIGGERQVTPFGSLWSPSFVSGCVQQQVANQRHATCPQILVGPFSFVNGFFRKKGQSLLNPTTKQSIAVSNRGFPMTD